MAEELRKDREAGDEDPPLDPDARREALARQAAELADLESQIAALTADSPDDAREPVHPVELLSRFRADLLRLAMREEYGSSGWVVVLGILDAAEEIIQRAVALDASPVPTLLGVIDDLRARVEAIGEAAQGIGPVH
jgi:hypothetical protein